MANNDIIHVNQFYFLHASCKEFWGEQFIGCGIDEFIMNKFFIHSVTTGVPERRGKAVSLTTRCPQGWRQRVFGLLVVFTCLTGAPAVADAQGMDDQWLRQHFSLENRTTLDYRFAGGEKDLDFYDHLYLRGSNLWGSRVDFYASGRLNKDLDGSSQSLANDLFAGGEDRENHWDDQVYQIYGDLHDIKNRYGLRLGRQYVEWAEGFQVDGGLARLAGC